MPYGQPLPLTTRNTPQSPPRLAASEIIKAQKKNSRLRKKGLDRNIYFCYKNNCKHEMGEGHE